MNDLYIEPADLTEGEMLNDPVCEGCEALAPLFRVGTCEEDGELLCGPCAEGTVKGWPGTVHDRREDPEKLLRAILLVTMNAPTAEALGTAMLDFVGRISRR